MTRSEPPRELAKLADVRDLTRRFKAGGQDSFLAFHELATLLLNLTVLESGSSLRLRGVENSPSELVLTSRAGSGALRLRNGAYLRLAIQLYLDPDANHRLKVGKSSYQYQVDELGDDWVFRYDYLRDPASEYGEEQGAYKHPYAHVQIRGTLHEQVLADGEELEALHFPTGRVPLEAVIRALVVQFRVPCATEESVWHPVLAEAEGLFQEIAHHPPSGPGAARVAAVRRAPLKAKRKARRARK